MIAIELEVLIIRILFCVISFIGCIWHVCDISSLYFSYKTNVNVQFEREVQVEMPSITLCTNVSFVVRDEYFKDNQATNSGKTLQNLTLDQQLLNATIGVQQFFNSCFVLKPISMENTFIEDYIGCENVSKIEESIDRSRKCFTLFQQKAGENDDNFRIDHDVILRDNSFPFYQIILNNRYLNDLVLFVHTRHQPFLGFIGGLTNGIHLNNTKYISFTFGYVKTTTRLLPAPYETNCLNYTSIGYKSQSHCIIKCKAEYFRQHFGGWHSDIPFTTEYDGNIHFVDEKWRTNRTVDKLIANHCLDVCGKKENCFNEYYTTNTIGEWEREGRVNEHLHGIFIYLPSGLNTRYIHSPRLHLIEYICYTASVFSLWFGISMTTLSKILIVLFNTYRNKNKNQKTKEKEPYFEFSKV